MKFGFLTASAALLLGACGQDNQAGNAVAGGNATATQKEGTLADVLAKGGDAQFGRVMQAAGVQQSLAAPGPYTVLVPTDQAFAKLPAGALDGLMKPEAKGDLTGVVTYHVLPGTMLAADIGKAIDNGQGKAMLATMNGGTLTATRDGNRIILADGNGGRAAVTAADAQASNGVIHRIDSVLMPPAGRSAG